MERSSGSARLRVMRPLLVVVLLLAIVTACSGSSHTGPSPVRESDVDLQGQWKLTSAEIQGEPLDAPAGSNFTLVVSGAGNQAHAGCTVVWLDPNVSGDSVTLRATDKGNMLSCPPETVQSGWDERYLRAIAAVEHAERSDDALTLTGPDETLTFAKAR